MGPSLLAVPVRLEAFAKVNLSLRVLGRRPDGFHELDTLFQTIDFSDELVFTEGEKFEFVCSEPGIPSGPENLVFKAGRFLAETAGVPLRGRVELTKRIPAGGGLGGGSADAAAALLGLSALWDLRPTAADLGPIAARLGSYVPFFLVGGTARGTGRGEIVSPLPDGPSEWLVLLLPPWPVSTSDVYGELGASELAELTGTTAASNLRGSGPDSFPDQNDLEEAAERLRGELAVLRYALRAAGATRARLSGSGSTLFGAFPDASAAAAAARRLEEENPGVRAVRVRTLDRSGFRKRACPDTMRQAGR